MPFFIQTSEVKECLKRMDLFRKTQPSGGDGFYNRVFGNNSLTTKLSGGSTEQVIKTEHNSSSLSQVDRLPNITIPTLLLWGKYDFVVPPALGEQALQLIGSVDKELVIFENSGHSPMSNEETLFTEELNKFIEILTRKHFIRYETIKSIKYIKKWNLTSTFIH